METHGDESKEYEDVCHFANQITIQAAHYSVTTGAAKNLLNRFDSPPTPILLIEGNDDYAHDLIKWEPH